MADFQYILPGAVGLPQGSNLYLWSPHIICGRTSMCKGHQSLERQCRKLNLSETERDSVAARAPEAVCKLINISVNTLSLYF